MNILSQTVLVCFATIGAMRAAEAAPVQGSTERGAQFFGACAACHSVQAGAHMTGPSLAHVWGRRAGSAEGFMRYSDALKNSGVIWNEKTLDKWLAIPAAFIPGNTMSFPGINDAKARNDLIAYLQAVSEGRAPAATPQGGGMMGGRGAPANLRQVAANAQVASITHCRDTYIVKTASGETRKIWEFNLRLKTDSSARGPVPGKPVATGSGMMGDRASIVFASPTEIGTFIKESCQ
jgi:cytochrome c